MKSSLPPLVYDAVSSPASRSRREIGRSLPHNVYDENQDRISRVRLRVYVVNRCEMRAEFG